MSFFDRFKLNEKPKKAELSNALGVTGVSYSMGNVREEFLRELQGRNAYKIYTEMAANESVLRAFLYAVESILKGHPLTLQAAEADLDGRYMEWMAMQWENAPFTNSEFLEEALTMLPYGYSLFEKIFEKGTDGRLQLKDLPTRKQSTVWEWFHDEAGKCTGLRQQDPINHRQIDIPTWKLLHYRFSNSSSPEGRSILRGAYKDYFYKKNFENQEAIGVERDLSGIPLISVPGDLLTQDTPEKVALVSEFKKIGTDLLANKQASILIPSDTYLDETTGKPTAVRMYSVDLMGATSNRSTETTAIIERHERAMARVALADFLMLGSSDSGSFALSKDKSALFLQSLMAVMDKIEQGLNRSVVKMLWDVNGLPPEMMPQFASPDIGQVSLTDTIAAMQLITLSTGENPPIDMIDALASKAGLPTEGLNTDVTGM